jgi:hypothetical protein
MRSQACLLLLAALAGCTGRRDSTPPPQPPPGTGLTEIDMEGHWIVADLVRIDDPAPVPRASYPGLPFLPLHEGALLTVRDGRLVDGAGEPLFETWSQTFPNRRYLNVSDRRVLLFDFFNAAKPDCEWHDEVRAAFGSVGADEMWGEVQVVTATTCPQPAVVMENPNGRFRMRLFRAVSVPAGAAASR